MRTTIVKINFVTWRKINLKYNSAEEYFFLFTQKFPLWKYCIFINIIPHRNFSPQTFCYGICFSQIKYHYGIIVFSQINFRYGIIVFSQIKFLICEQSSSANLLPDSSYFNTAQFSTRLPSGWSECHFVISIISPFIHCQISLTVTSFPPIQKSVTK